MAYPNDEWQRKGATLSDKTARQEFGLTQDEIYDAIDAGTLQYRQAYMHGNPWLRLLRREVEALARARHGGGPPALTRQDCLPHARVSGLLMITELLALSIQGCHERIRCPHPHNPPQEEQAPPV